MPPRPSAVRFIASKFADMADRIGFSVDGEIVLLRAGVEQSRLVYRRYAIVFDLPVGVLVAQGNDPAQQERDRVNMYALLDPTTLRSPPVMIDFEEGQVTIHHAPPADRL